MRGSLGNTCYLHVGTHKTGSTTIQNFLTSSLENLEARGILMPSISTAPVDQDHKKLANALTNFAVHKGDIAPLHQLSAFLNSSSSDIIISAETLSQKIGRAGEFSALKQYFKSHGYRLHVILYLRDQTSYINSLYVQSVKRFKYSQSFSTYLKEALSDSFSSFNYLRRYEFLMDDPEIVFDPRPFSKAIRGGLIPDFLSAIPPLADMNLAGHSRTPKILNPNAGTKSVFVARMVSNAIEERHPRTELVKLSPLLKRNYMARNWHEQPFVGLDQEYAKSIRRTFVKSNNKISQRYWGCDWVDLHPPARWERSVFSFADASARDKREVLDVIKLLLHKLGRTSRDPKRFTFGNLWRLFKS